MRVNKIIPVISIIAAALTAAISAVGLTLVSVAVKAPQLTLVAVPTAIVGLSLAFLGVAFGVLFFKDKLCRIALFIDSGSLALSTAAIIVWLAAL